MIPEILAWCRENRRTVGVFFYPNGEIEICNADSHGEFFIGWEDRNVPMHCHGRHIAILWEQFKNAA